MFRYTKATAVREVLVWVITLFMLLPFYILIVTSLKTDQEALTTSAVAPPTSLDFSAFVEVLTTTGRNSIPMSILNSVIITAGAIFGLVLLGSVAAYVIARRTRRWTTITFYLVLIAIILPAQLGTVPLYIGARTRRAHRQRARHDPAVDRHPAATVGVPLRELLPRPVDRVRGGGRHRRGHARRRRSSASCCR